MHPSNRWKLHGNVYISAIFCANKFARNCRQTIAEKIFANICRSQLEIRWRIRYSEWWEIVFTFASAFPKPMINWPYRFYETIFVSQASAWAASEMSVHCVPFARWKFNSRKWWAQWPNSYVPNIRFRASFRSNFGITNTCPWYLGSESGFSSSKIPKSNIAFERFLMRAWIENGNFAFAIL